MLVEIYMMSNARVGFEMEKDGQQAPISIVREEILTFHIELLRLVG
jgi:hypothetical protein